MTRTSADLIADRTRLLGAKVTTFYEEPVHLVRGEGVWVWDADGRQYLDCYNNVPHVGHCHPKVVEAVATQAATLNTHTRYLHEGILRYLDRLTASFADPLSMGVLTCTGSEANDLALRMAEAVTGKRGIIVTDHTYHGNTTAVAALSRTNPPKTGDGSHIRHVPAPDSYRPLGGQAGAAHARAFAAEVQRAISDLEEAGHGFSCMMLCPFFANEGFPDLDPGFLAPTEAAIRAAGGVLIADEVQPGFGRLGSHMWGHQRTVCAPDIVTLGKPMGNGFPVAGVITSPAVMEAFQETFRYFNTFAGNPVACAAAEAVLDVIEEEGLMARAADVGAYAKTAMQQLAAQHAVIGDVRGAGLFCGVELVTDRASKAPAAAFTTRMVDALRQDGILLNRLGIHYNTLKIRPNLQFSRAHVDQMVEALHRALQNTPIQA
ncbi:Omega-amino acid--pyruvate aminotransferase [Candidatus Rhodobacter oscarellae]|uniref:Omega-amino acid--pyruvate aminotransferase n=1 Tax=Candidatus Rhodobacter oscarellae TaxID=1675527 RepID=A0A0J9GZ22_9RHOB|nr:aminotransferase class III-fold pyridoxal phosphate-dependent enzyme [Candidatus Rhodobacter lobularis]KMW58718.1 Omega-amino acid--pyruvate aminotransferase [Candidatus Rhodobacter lobularis]